MHFELTPEIVDQIIFAMENQESGFVVDTRTGSIIHGAAVAEEEAGEYVEIPRWNSADGFHLMEKFVSTLRNPLAREKLRQALSSGRGVFRSFKDALKEQPGVERRWFVFKDREMKNRVVEWYNELREAWGIERIDPFLEPDETDELVESDFIVAPESGSNRLLVRDLDRQGYFEAYENLPSGLIEERFRRARIGYDLESDRSILLTALTPTADFGGFAWCWEEAYDSQASEEGERVRVLKILQLYVLPEFRGLGLAKMLVRRICLEARNRTVDEVTIALPGTSNVLSGWLETLGFAPLSRSMILDLSRREEDEFE